MGVTERKARERAEREHRIIGAARRIAESEGWDAMTIRRLADAIEYSQPVLYSHFANRAAIVAAVAVEGFGELASALRLAAERVTGRRQGCESVAEAYLAFAREQPRLYEAMFTLQAGLTFAVADSNPELKEAFAALAGVVAPSSDDLDVATETFWATLHGLAELERSGRIRVSARQERIALTVSAFGSF